MAQFQIVYPACHICERGRHPISHQLKEHRNGAGHFCTAKTSVCTGCMESANIVQAIGNQPSSCAICQCDFGSLLAALVPKARRYRITTKRAEIDYYQFLGISRTATNAELESAYRRRARVDHPDKPTGTKEKFNKLVDIYEMLLDPNRREEYDRTLSGREAGPAPNQDLAENVTEMDCCRQVKANWIILRDLSPPERKAWFKLLPKKVHMLKVLEGMLDWGPGVQCPMGEDVQNADPQGKDTKNTTGFFKHIRRGEPRYFSRLAFQQIHFITCETSNLDEALADHAALQRLTCEARTQFESAKAKHKINEKTCEYYRIIADIVLEVFARAPMSISYHFNLVFAPDENNKKQQALKQNRNLARTLKEFKAYGVVMRKTSTTPDEKRERCLKLVENHKKCLEYARKKTWNEDRIRQMIQDELDSRGVPQLESEGPHVQAPKVRLRGKKSPADAYRLYLESGGTLGHLALPGLAEVQAENGLSNAELAPIAEQMAQDPEFSRVAERTLKKVIKGHLKHPPS